MEETGHRPLLNMTDNQAAQPLKAFFENKRMQMTIRRTSQSQSKRSGKSNTNFLKTPHQWLLLHRQRVAAEIMEQSYIQSKH